MIKIGIDPYIATLGPFALSWHGFFTFVAVVVAIYVIVRIARRLKLDENHVYNAAVWVVPAGIVGARLFHVVENWGFYGANPSLIPAIWSGGLAIYGAVIGGTIAGIIYARLARVPVGRFCDVCAPGVVLGMAVGRIGDIINGEHFSLYTSMPWGFVYTHPNSPSVMEGITYAQHPAVAYEMLWDLVVLAVLWRLLGRVKPDGMLFALYFALYSFGRFFISFYRYDKILFLGLREAQDIALVALLVTVPLVAYRARLIKPEAPAPPPGATPVEQAPAEEEPGSG